MTTDVTIRPFKSPDAQAVIALWAKALPAVHPWHEPRSVICRKLQLDDGLFFVGEDNGQVVATAIAGYDGVRGWIYSLAVADELRYQGVGRRILQEVENVLRSKGCVKINLQVRGNNRGVIGFYERCGFAVEDRASLAKPLGTTRETVADPVPTLQVNDQITLSQITWDDRPSYLKHLNETDAFHAQTNWMPYPYLEIDADRWLTRVVGESLESDHRRHWAIRNRDGELIGGAGLAGITGGEKAEIGYWLAKPYWGRGIMTGSVRQICRHGFDQYKLHRIHAQAIATNTGSARVLEKAGFQLEGTLRSHHYRDGKAHDILAFGLLNDTATAATAP